MGKKNDRFNPGKKAAHRNEITRLFEQVRGLILSARCAAARSIDTLQVLTNFKIGRLIVEHEQSGQERAQYGREVLKVLASRLSDEFGRGYSRSNLEYMRRFYIEYRNKLPGIPQTLSAQSLGRRKSQTLSGILSGSQKGQTLADRLKVFSARLPLSWSHYVFLLQISDQDERSFYEIESAQNAWAIRELKRQFDSGLYERLALSRKKSEVRRLARKGQIIEKPADIIKQPYVLEFLGIDEQAKFTETDLETAIIDKLEHFLLELGKGFLFETRQKRFTFDEDHFFVDLVFYNRLLSCYVLIDLKIGKLTHQDLGQMQMYVNYFDRHVKLPQEAPTIGIVLCKMKNSALVKLTLPENTNVYASPYQVYLPSKQELKQKLMEWTR